MPPTDARWKVIFTGRLHAHQLPGMSASTVVDVPANQLQQTLGTHMLALDAAFDVVADEERLPFILLDNPDFSDAASGTAMRRTKSTTARVQSSSCGTTAMSGS